MGWRTDWLYRLVFDSARKVWREAERYAEISSPADPQPPLDRIVISETMTADFQRSICRGPIQRSWSFDGVELREIPVPEVTASRPVVRRNLFAQGCFLFCIAANRKRVVIDYTLGPLYGRGYCYRVHGQARTGELRLDPEATGWIS